MVSQQTTIRTYLDNTGYITLHEKDRLGGGAVGTVFGYGGDRAIKIFHKAEPWLKRKVNYLLANALSWKLPNNVAYTLNATRDQEGGNLSGYEMLSFGAKARKASLLLHEGHSRNFGFGLAEKCAFFEHAFGDLALFQSRNLIVVDWGPQNILILKSGTRSIPGWIDFETWKVEGVDFQEDVVFNPEYVDPLLFDPMTWRLMRAPTKEHDNYALTYLFFSALMGYSPFDGDHDRVAELHERKAQRLWVYGASVNEPNFGKHREVLSDPMLGWFEDYFARDMRYVPPVNMVQSYRKGLVKCRSCSAEYHQSRRQCPVCRKASPQQVPTMADLVTLVKSQGTVEACFYDGSRVCVVAYENGRVVSYLKQQQGEAVRSELIDQEPALRFEFFGGRYLAINRPEALDQTVENDEIEIWDIEDGMGPVAKTLSMPFAGESDLAVFAGTRDYLMRIASRYILSGMIDSQLPRLGLQERRTPVGAAMNQTWFWSDSRHNRLVGYYQHMERQYFWVLVDGARYEIEIEALLYPKETLVQNPTVVFSDNAALVRRLSKEGNEQFIRTDVIVFDGDMEPQIESFDRKSMRGHLSPYSTGIAFGDLDGEYYVWHPTVKGILQEELVSGKTRTLAQTNRMVGPSDQLFQIGKEGGFGQHFIVRKRDSVLYVYLR